MRNHDDRVRLVQDAIISRPLRTAAEYVVSLWERELRLDADGAVGDLRRASAPVVPVELTEDSARAVGTAMREAANLVALPIENDRELRAICLRLALDTKAAAFTLKDDDTWSESADRILAVARRYHAFITEDENAHSPKTKEPPRDDAD